MLVKHDFSDAFSHFNYLWVALQVQRIGAYLQALHEIPINELFSVQLKHSQTYIVQVDEVICVWEEVFFILVREGRVISNVIREEMSTWFRDACKDVVPNRQEAGERKLSGEHASEPLKEDQLWLDLKTLNVEVYLRI